MWKPNDVVIPPAIEAYGPRIAVIGNAGGGKSTLARRLAETLNVPHYELDRILWRPDWTPSAPDVYEHEHTGMILAAAWIIDGLGMRQSVPARPDRATAIVLVHMPVWMHFWLAAERQTAWNEGTLDHPPALAKVPPPTDVLFRTTFDVDQQWMPDIWELVDLERQKGKHIVRISDVDELQRDVEELPFKD